MQLVTAPSKSSQIAEIIRRQIFSGKLSPGEKLQSVRNLAEEFKVGRQVVLSAFSLLEKEKLIHMKARQGAFVIDKNASDTGRGIYFLAYGINKNNKYLQNILKMTYPPYLKKGYNFFTRIIPIDLMSDDLFEMELRRIDNTPDIDAVIIHSANLTKKQIEKCVSLRIPVVFVGEFNKGKFADLKINQVWNCSSYAARCVNYLIQLGHKEIFLLTSSLQYSYNLEFLKKAQKIAKTQGVALKAIEFPSGFHSMKDKDRIAVDKLKKELPKNTKAILISGVGFETAKKALASVKHDFLKKADVLTTEENVDGAACMEYDNSGMYESIYSLLERLFENKNLKERIAIESKFIIVKKESFQYHEDAI